MKYQRGMTLLEMLLVTALIAIIAVGGISIYRIRAEQHKLEMTALRIQAWLQAGMAFYLDEQHWPDTNDNLQTYLPAKSEKTTWGETITIKQDDTNANLFRVQTTMPSVPLARRLAGMLPNAFLENENDTRVIAEVGKPVGMGGGSQYPNHPWIVRIEKLDIDLTSLGLVFKKENYAQNLQAILEASRKYVNFPTKKECPRDRFKPGIYLAINKIQNLILCSKRKKNGMPDLDDPSSPYICSEEYDDLNPANDKATIDLQMHNLNMFTNRSVGAEVVLKGFTNWITTIKLRPFWQDPNWNNPKKSKGYPTVFSGGSYVAIVTCEPKPIDEQARKRTLSRVKSSQYLF